MPRWQGSLALTMGKSLKFTATSAFMLPGRKKMQWPGMYPKFPQKIFFWFFQNFQNIIKLYFWIAFNF
jgi:hypothetical protein